MGDLRPAFTTLAQSLRAQYQIQGDPTGYFWVDRFALQRGGAQIEVNPKTGSKGAFLGAQFTVTLPAKVSNGDVRLRKERALDRLGSKLKINREFQSGDPAFDQAVYVESDAPDATLKRLLSGPARELIANVVSVRGLEVSIGDPEFGLGTIDAAALEIQRTRVTIFAPASTITDAAAMAPIPDVVVALARALFAAHEQGTAAAASPDAYGRGQVPADLRSEVALGVAWGNLLAAGGVVVANWIVASAMRPPPTTGGGSTLVGIAMGAALWTLDFLLIVLLLRGRSTSLRSVGFAMMFVFFGPFMTGVRVAKTLNASLAPAGEQVVMGTAVVRTGNKGARWVQLDVGDARYSLPREEEARLGVGSSPTPVRVVLREGAFGDRWVQRVDQGF